MTRRSQATTADITIYVENDGWEAEVEMVVHFDPGCAPWKGSMYTCPSSDDYYGVPATFECVDKVTSVTVCHDGAPKGETLTGWEFDHAARDIVARVEDEDGDLSEAVDSALDEAFERMAEDEMDCRW